MTIADWVQIASLIFVAGALIASSWQTREIVRQTVTLTEELFNNVSTSLAQVHTDQRTAFFLDDPELLAWYLSSRGYRSTNPLENRQRLYALVKFDTHESIHLRHTKGMIDEPMWKGWLRVLEVDLQVPVFADVWENGRQFYEASFAELVDSVFEQQSSSKETKPAQSVKSMAAQSNGATGTK